MNYQKKANDFCKKYNVKINIELSKNQTAPLWHKDGEEYGLKYDITISRPNKKDFDFSFWNSIFDKQKGLRPTNYSILACLTKHDPEDFESFCDNFGYDQDSITAHKTFLAVNKEWHKTNNMFNDCMEELQEIN